MIPPKQANSLKILAMAFNEICRFFRVNELLPQKINTNSKKFLILSNIMISFHYQFLNIFMKYSREL